MVTRLNEWVSSMLPFYQSKLNRTEPIFKQLCLTTVCVVYANEQCSNNFSPSCLHTEPTDLLPKESCPPPPLFLSYDRVNGISPDSV